MCKIEVLYEMERRARSLLPCKYEGTAPSIFGKGLKYEKFHEIVGYYPPLRFTHCTKYVALRWWCEFARANYYSTHLNVAIATRLAVVVNCM